MTSVSTTRIYFALMLMLVLISSLKWDKCNTQPLEWSKTPTTQIAPPLPD